MTLPLTTGEGIAAVKIDTEGFEPRVLQSLRPVWHLLTGSVVVELQPHSWERNGIPVEEAFTTLRDFGRATGYVVVTLPHRTGEGNESSTATDRGLATGAKVDPCKVRPLSSMRWTPQIAIAKAGMGSAVTMSFADLEAGLRQLLQKGGGFFHDVLFARKSC